MLHCLGLTEAKGVELRRQEEEMFTKLVQPATCICEVLPKPYSKPCPDVDHSAWLSDLCLFARLVRHVQLLPLVVGVVIGHPACLSLKLNLNNLS